MLPADVRDQMGLAYLFARAADTIADTDLIGREERLQYLNQFRAQFTTGDVRRKDVQAIQAALAPHQTDSAERMLLQRLDEFKYEGRRGRYSLRDTPGLFGWLRRWL